MDSSVEGVKGEGAFAEMPVSAGLGLAPFMDELSHGVLLASLSGQLLHANHSGRHELARRHVLALHDGVLHTIDAAQARVLTQALAKAETGRRSLMALRGPGRQRVSIAVLPLRPDRPIDAPHVALVFARSSVCDPVMLCFFARTHGLTPSEEQVLAILCQGYSAPQTALQLGVAVSTVRSHVRSMCVKTHANGVRALVSQVAVLPPIGAAHLHAQIH
jgi:DNA-binding CsgD family transcriptional regulator